MCLGCWTVCRNESQKISPSRTIIRSRGGPKLNDIPVNYRAYTSQIHSAYGRLPSTARLPPVYQKRGNLVVSAVNCSRPDRSKNRRKQGFPNQSEIVREFRRYPLRLLNNGLISAPHLKSLPVTDGRENPICAGDVHRMGGRQRAPHLTPCSTPPSAAPARPGGARSRAAGGGFQDAAAAADGAAPRRR